MDTLQDTLQIRNKLYRVTLICTVCFAVLSCVLMIGFKRNEAFFDTHGHISILAENELEAAIQDSSHTGYNKRNVPVTFVDSQENKLVIPLTEQLEMSRITVREEFTQDKIVITLKEAKNCIAQNAEVISDSHMMDAVGIYRQKDDIVIEVYCKDAYAYEVNNQPDCLTLSFIPVREKYEKIAVVFIPYEDRTRLISMDWQTEMTKYAEENSLKLYLSATMQEEYTQAAVAAFANQIHADMLIGMVVQQSTEGNGVEAVCNTDYFIPDFGNTELASLMGKAFSEHTGVEFAGYRTHQEKDVLLANAKVPTALAVIHIQTAQENTLELDYNLNHGMMSAVSEIIEQLNAK